MKHLVQEFRATDVIERIGKIHIAYIVGETYYTLCGINMHFLSHIKLTESEKIKCNCLKCLKLR